MIDRGAIFETSPPKNKVISSAIALFTGGILLTGCQTEILKVTPDVNLLYTCNADILWGEMEAEMELKRLGGGDWDVNFTAPTTLAGMTVSLRDGNATYSLGELSGELDEGNIPETSLFSLLFDTLDDAAINPSPCTVDEGVLIMKGRTDSGAYQLLFDEESKTLCGINLPDSQLEGVIGNFSEITISPTMETSITME